MKLSLALLVLAVGLVYGIIVNFFPDFPVSQEVFLNLIVWLLTLLGVQIVEPVVRNFLVKRGLRGFQK